MNEFAILKLKGEAQETKAFQAPITNMIRYKKWRFGYCIEQNIFNTQRILSVSHEGGFEFDSNKPFKEIPELKIYFPYKISFVRTFKNRGFTRMYVVER